MDKKPNLMKSMEQKELERKVEELEKRVATLEGQVQEQLSVKFNISNVKEFKDLVNQTIEDLDKIKSFSFEVKHKI